jgi:Helix-turn-helix domain
VQFLRELRQLRDGAGLEQSELAARAHYPYDRIKAAEVGPTLPDLPVLSAYVRGCGGTTEEWEERWRSLTSAPTLPLLGTRPAGCSTAASAGARIGSISPVADTPDPSIILAALDRVAEEMAVSTPAPLPSHAGVSTIEQRPAISPAAAAATAATAKSASSKAGTGTAAGTGKVAAWETTTMRTAWSSAAAPTAREVGQPTAVGGPTGAAGPTTAAGAGTSTAAGAEAPAGSTGYTAATSGKAAVATGGSSGTGGSAAVKPVASAPGASTRATAVSGPSTIGRRSRGLSRTTVAALIAIAVCVLVALLATFA